MLRALGAEIVRTPSLAGYDAPGAMFYNFLLLIRTLSRKVNNYVGIV